MTPIKNILFFIAMLFASAYLYADSGLQEKAEKLYAEKKYKQVITSYETLIKNGYQSPKLYYNLGNAYYKNNELGKAIYYYELARKSEPSNEDIKTNLRIANAKTIDEIESKENFFIGALKSGLVNSLSTTAWAWLSIISLISCLGLAFLFFVSKQLLIKRISFFASLVFLVIFISSMMLGFTALNDKQHIQFAIIVSHETKIYDEPSITSVSKFNLHEGTKVKVLETNSQWTNIKLENGNEGWIKTAELGLF